MNIKNNDSKCSRLLFNYIFSYQILVLRKCLLLTTSVEYYIYMRLKYLFAIKVTKNIYMSVSIIFSWLCMSCDSPNNQLALLPALFGTSLSSSDIKGRKRVDDNYHDCWENG